MGLTEHAIVDRRRLLALVFSGTHAHYFRTLQSGWRAIKLYAPMITFILIHNDLYCIAKAVQEFSKIKYGLNKRWQ